MGHHIIHPPIAAASLGPASTLRGHAPTSITIHPDAKSSPTAPGAENFWGEDGFTFGDLLDIINPLQHIPIVSTIYQHITGDTASPGANIIGGALLGGPLGMVASIANEVVTQASGKDIMDNALALLDDAPAADEKAAQIAENTEDVELAAVLAEIPELAKLDNSGLIGRAEPKSGKTFSAHVAPAQAAAAYNNAQEAILAIFDPESLKRPRAVE